MFVNQLLFKKLMVYCTGNALSHLAKIYKAKTSKAIKFEIQVFGHQTNYKAKYLK